MEKLSNILFSLSKYIQEFLKSDKGEYTSPKAFLYQMYFVIAKLDAEKLARMNYLVNFGVSLDSIHVIADIMNMKSEYRDAVVCFKKIPFI